MLAIPPFGASSNIALMRANNKPPVELVVDDLECIPGNIPIKPPQNLPLYSKKPLIKKKQIHAYTKGEIESPTPIIINP